jgi:hypothetical protein
MDDAAREAAEDHLVRDSDAMLDSIEVVRHKRSGDHVTILARWTEAEIGRLRRGAVDLVMHDGVWRASGGWSSNADHDSDHPVWRAWGGTSHSMSGWVSDPTAVTVRFRDRLGRIEEDTVQDGVAILIYGTGFDPDSVVELLDGAGIVVRSAPLA